MAEIKLTKNELRLQQKRLSQLQKYLPTLQLKKAMLQLVVQEARLEIEKWRQELVKVTEKAAGYAELLSEKTSVDLMQIGKIDTVEKTYENIAGVEVPYLKSVSFTPLTYSLFETPAWIDSVIEGLRGIVEAQLRVKVAQEKKDALEHELRQVSIRVNLFEKILIPRALANIRKVRVFLGDQELSAVGRAKVAKEKIQDKRRQVLDAHRS